MPLCYVTYPYFQKDTYAMDNFNNPDSANSISLRNQSNTTLPSHELK